ncbi:MAG: efflux RND transporter periplasmic adaptor subunit, partial [Rubrivivax sp.]|nr:efflux RND transporter periplasmic adaptor subunit [Rubrivivax sp.]
MSRRQRWIVALVVVLILAAFAGRTVMQRLAARSAAPAVPAAAQAIELAATDVAIVARTELGQSLAVSGGLKARDSAVVKAKVAAELRELTVREGDRVSAGQRIGRLDDTEYRWRLRQAEDQVGAAQAQFDIAQRTLANNRALVDQGFISKNALDTSASSAGGALASLQAARAAAELARKAVADCEVIAPLAGLVSQRFVQPGERVGVDARLLEIVDLTLLELEAAIAGDDVPALRVGQTARLQVDGLADDVPARVVRINPSAQPGTRAVTAYLAVLPFAGQAALRQGLFARGSIELQRRSALAIPESALRLDQAKPYVLLVSDG